MKREGWRERDGEGGMEGREMKREGWKERDGEGGMEGREMKREGWKERDGEGGMEGREMKRERWRERDGEENVIPAQTQSVWKQGPQPLPKDPVCSCSSQKNSRVQRSNWPMSPHPCTVWTGHS